MEPFKDTVRDVESAVNQQKTSHQAIADQLTEHMRAGRFEQSRAMISSLHEAPKEHVTGIARAFMGKRYTSKKAALDDIQHRHDMLTSMSARAKATGGRTAG